MAFRVSAIPIVFGLVLVVCVGCDGAPKGDTESEGPNGEDAGEGTDTDQALFGEVFKDPIDDEAAVLFNPLEPMEIRLTLPPALTHLLNASGTFSSHLRLGTTALFRWQRYWSRSCL